MPIGKPKETKAAPTVTTRAVVTHKKQEIDRQERTYSLTARTFKDQVVYVKAAHQTGMNINFQGVQTYAEVVIPCTVSAVDIKLAFEEAWDIVEQELASRQEWAKAVLDTLVEAKEAAERR